MDFSALIGILPYLLQAVQVAQGINNDIKSGSTHTTAGVLDTIQRQAPAVIDVFQKIGSVLFPNVPAANQSAAAASALDISTAGRIQSALNSHGASPALMVDGQYGPKTKAAVLAFQQANGLTADEWAGPLTQKALGVI